MVVSLMQDRVLKYNDLMVRKGEHKKKPQNIKSEKPKSASTHPNKSWLK